jgi:hypothetical protein
MRRVLLAVALLLLAACAHQQPADPPPLRMQLMARCAEACAPAEAVQAAIAVDSTADVWQCLCRSPEPAISPGT